MAITADPDSVLNHYALGVLLDTTERSAISTSASAAEEEAERCTELDPDFADAYQLLASAYARQGRLKDSLAAVQKAIALSPRDEIYSLNLASLWLKLHQYSDALALLRRLKASHNPEISRKADSFLSTAIEH
jgi:Flp pilus assembly protein TadD